jgi:hypothetical protein
MNRALLFLGNGHTVSVTNLSGTSPPPFAVLGAAELRRISLKAAQRLLDSGPGPHPIFKRKFQVKLAREA